MEIYEVKVDYPEEQSIDDQETQPEDISEYEIPEHLVLPELLRERCQQSVFFLWNLLNVALSKDKDVLTIRWLRGLVKPKLILFDAQVGKDACIEVAKHDFIRITCAGGQCICLDVTADQWGYGKWIYTSEEYSKEVLDADNPSLEFVEVDDEIQEIETTNDDMRLMRAAIEMLIEELVDPEGVGGKAWAKFDTMPESELDGLFDEMAEVVRARLMDEANAIESQDSPPSSDSEDEDYEDEDYEDEDYEDEDYEDEDYEDEDYEDDG